LFLKLSLCFLGSPQVQVDSRPVELTAQKALALPAGPQRRDALLSDTVEANGQTI
jgi:hypothetical protein